MKKIKVLDNNLNLDVDVTNEEFKAFQELQKLGVISFEELNIKELIK